jgi:hypothetical protein
MIGLELRVMWHTTRNMGEKLSLPPMMYPTCLSQALRLIIFNATSKY